MRLWIANLWDDIRSSFWFVPTLMVAGAVALSLGAIRLDRAAGDRDPLAELGWIFSRGPEGSRALLSTVAASMMTITSVTFSITIVALQLASSQFGPRLLRNFMRDRGNQVALGAFIATFTYCLLVLRTVNGTEDGRFVPHIAVTIGLLLALASLGVLIYFIHHAAASIQAENVIGAVSGDLHRAIDRLFPEEHGEPGPRPPGADPEPDMPPGFDEQSRAVEAPCSDYLQAVDLDRLIELASKHDLVIRVERRPGRFANAGDALVRAWPGARLDDGLARAIRESFLFGSHRTPTQDVEFAVDQLVEVAVRALSPGVNDPFTAILCVDRLGAALCHLATRRSPSPYRLDGSGRLRVVVDASTPGEIVDAAFHQIRQAARGDAAVAIRLLEALEAVARHARTDELRVAVRRHADLVHRGSQEGLPDPHDRIAAEVRYRRVLEALEPARPAAVV